MDDFHEGLDTPTGIKKAVVLTHQNLEDLRKRVDEQDVAMSETVSKLADTVNDFVKASSNNSNDIKWVKTLSIFGVTCIVSGASGVFWVSNDAHQAEKRMHQEITDHNLEQLKEINAIRLEIESQKVLFLSRESPSE